MVSFLWSKHKFTTIIHLQIHHAHCLFFSWCRMESPHCMWLPKGETQTWWSSCWIVEGRSMPKPGWVFLFPEYDVVPSWEWIGIFWLLVVFFFPSQRLGTPRFIARNSTSVIVSCSLFLKWDIRCSCCKSHTHSQKRFSWTQLQNVKTLPPHQCTLFETWTKFKLWLQK